MRPPCMFFCHGSPEFLGCNELAIGGPQNNKNGRAIL
jgi:hypothetical protein